MTSFAVAVIANALVGLSVRSLVLYTPAGSFIRPMGWALSMFVLALAALPGIPFAVRGVNESLKARRWGGVIFGCLCIALCVLPLPLSHFLLGLMAQIKNWHIED